MPRSHGKQRRAEKQKKRRDARKRPANARRAPAAAAAATPDFRPACGYDASHAPPDEWLELDEAERLRRVERFHLEALPASRQPPSLPRHAGMHVAVENQLAADTPPQARQALRRLMGEGMTRHDAVHAIGSIMMEHMKRALDARSEMDNLAYMRDLEQLTTASWLARIGAGR